MTRRPRCAGSTKQRRRNVKSRRRGRFSRHPAWSRWLSFWPSSSRTDLRGKRGGSMGGSRQSLSSENTRGWRTSLPDGPTIDLHTDQVREEDSRTVVEHATRRPRERESWFNAVHPTSYKGRLAATIRRLRKGSGSRKAQCCDSRDRPIMFRKTGSCPAISGGLFPPREPF